MNDDWLLEPGDLQDYDTVTVDIGGMSGSRLGPRRVMVRASDLLQLNSSATDRVCRSLCLA